MAGGIDEEELNDFLERVDLVKKTINDLSTNEPSAIDKADKVIKQLDDEKRDQDTSTTSKSSPTPLNTSNTNQHQLYRLGDGWTNQDHLYYCQRCKIEILYDIYDFDNNDDALKIMIDEYNKSCEIDLNTNNINNESKENLTKIRCGACPKCNITNKNIIISAQERKDILQERVDALKKEYQRRMDRRTKWEKYEKMRNETENKLENKTQRKKHTTDYEEWAMWEPEIDLDEYTEDGYIPNIPEARAMAADMQKRAEKKKDQVKAATKEKEQGNAALKDGDYAAAIRHYTIGIDYCKDFKQLYTNRGLAYMKTGQYNKCIEDCNTVIEMITYVDAEEIKSDVAFKAYLRRANAHKMLGNLEDALTDALMCKKRRPKRKEVLTFLDDVQVLLYNDRQRKKMQQSMKEKKEELSDFDLIFDKIVSQLEFELSEEPDTTKNQNEPKPDPKDESDEFKDEKKDDIVTTNNKDKDNQSISNSPRSLKHTRRSFDKLLEQMKNLMKNSADYCVRFADRNGIDLLSRYLQKSLEILQKSLLKLSKKNSESTTVTNTRNRNNNNMDSRREMIQTRVEIEMEMRTYIYLFEILNYCVSHEINLSFLKGHRTQVGYGRVQNESRAKTEVTAVVKSEEKEEKNDVKSKVSKAMKLYKKEKKIEKAKKLGNSIVQYNSKQMKIIIGSMIFYIVRDFSKYSKTLQKESMKFVSVATKINDIAKWLCQIHSKLIVSSIITVLSISKEIKQSSGLKRRRGMKLKSSGNNNNKTNQDNTDQGVDLEALEYLFVTLLNLLNFEENEGFLTQLLQFSQPYIFVGLFNKLNEYGNYVLQSQTEFERFRRNTTTQSIPNDNIFGQKQHIVSIILNVLSKVFTNVKLVKAFVDDQLTGERIKSLLKHLSRLVDTFVTFERFHLSSVVKMYSQNSLLTDALLTQHGNTMSQIAKCINVLLSLIHHSASHALLLEMRVHNELYEMIGIIYDAHHRETKGDKEINKVRDNIENYDLLINSIEDNILGFLDKISIYPEFDNMIETCDLMRHSLLSKQNGFDINFGRKLRYNCLKSNKTMIFWNYVLSSLEERQLDILQTSKDNHNINSSKSEEKDEESESKLNENNNVSNNKFYFESCVIRMLLRWLKRCLVGHAKGETVSNDLQQIVETFIYDNFSVFCTFLTKRYGNANTIVANITLVVKQFLIYIKNFGLYARQSGSDDSDDVIKQKTDDLKNLVIDDVFKNNRLNDIMDLFRNDDKTVRRNAVTLMAQLATFDEKLKEKIRDIGAMTAMYQLQREITSQTTI